MNFIKLFLFFFLFSLITSTDYHGDLYDIKGEYLSGNFTFDEDKLPLNTTKFNSFQMRHPESLESMLIKNININLQFEYENILHIKITDSNNPDRWQVPDDIIDTKYTFNLHKNIKSKPSF